MSWKFIINLTTIQKTLRIERTPHKIAIPQVEISTIHISGSVALIVGGVDTNSVEVYSPEGKCQHELAPIPNEAPGEITNWLDLRRRFCQFLGQKQL